MGQERQLQLSQLPTLFSRYTIFLHGVMILSFLLLFRPKYCCFFFVNGPNLKFSVKSTSLGDTYANLQVNSNEEREACKS